MTFTIRFREDPFNANSILLAIHQVQVSDKYISLYNKEYIKLFTDEAQELFESLRSDIRHWVESTWTEDEKPNLPRLDDVVYNGTNLKTVRRWINEAYGKMPF